MDFLVHYNRPYLKIPSAHLTNHALLRKVCHTGVPLILSTGMSTEFEIGAAMQVLHDEKANTRVTLLHTVSAYPCRNAFNVNVMKWLDSFCLALRPPPDEVTALRNRSPETSENDDRGFATQ